MLKTPSVVNSVRNAELLLSPSVGNNKKERFVIAWSSNNQEGSLAGVFARKYEENDDIIEEM